MSVLDNLITDRTARDVGRTLKGSYRSSDWNRVGEACTYLYGIFQQYGYNVPGYVSLRTDRTNTDVPTASDAEDMINTVSGLKTVLSAAQTIPNSMDHLTFEDANNIEKLFLEVDDLLERLGIIPIFSGLHESGEMNNHFAGIPVYDYEGRIDFGTGYSLHGENGHVIMTGPEAIPGFEMIAGSDGHLYYSAPGVDGLEMQDSSGNLIAVY